jgi:hypothetical protein
VHARLPLLQCWFPSAPFLYYKKGKRETSKQNFWHFTKRNKTNIANCNTYFSPPFWNYFLKIFALVEYEYICGEAKSEGLSAHNNNHTISTLNKYYIKKLEIANYT